MNYEQSLTEITRWGKKSVKKKKNLHQRQIKVIGKIKLHSINVSFTNIHRKKQTMRLKVLLAKHTLSSTLVAAVVCEKQLRVCVMHVWVLVFISQVWNETMTPTE